MRITLGPARRAASLLLALGALAMMAACDGPAHPPAQIPITVTATDATGPLERGQAAVFTFTVTNPSNDSIAGVTVTAAPQAIDGATPLLTGQDVTCVAQGATCPAFTAQGFQPTTMPAGSVLTFTVTTVVSADYDGTADEQFSVDATSRTGTVIADGHATLADARDGFYLLYGTSGRVASLNVQFIPGAMTFSYTNGNAPATFQRDSVGYVFADGSHMVSGPDRLHGSYDFGGGVENFIAVRKFETDLAALDGATFTLFSATSGGTTPATTSVQTAWIAGSTLTICVDGAPQTAATCPAASQWHYALTSAGTFVIAIDSVHGDTFQFSVAIAGGTRVFLRGNSGGGDAGHFAIGLPTPSTRTGSPQYDGTTLGIWTDVQLSQTTYATATFQGQAGFGPLGPVAALQDVPGGPPGLRQGVRVDGAPLIIASSDDLAVQIGAPGQLDIFGFLIP